MDINKKMQEMGFKAVKTDPPQDKLMFEMDLDNYKLSIEIATDRKSVYWVTLSERGNFGTRMFRKIPIKELNVRTIIKIVCEFSANFKASKMRNQIISMIGTME
jgi:hypothetical protein